jgi:hypothetical protein
MHTFKKGLFTWLFLWIGVTGFGQCFVSAGSNDTVCQGAVLIKNANVVPNNVAISWSLLSTPTTILSNAPVFTVPTGTAGTFDYLVRINGANCTAADTVRVVVRPKPMANFTYTSNCGRNFNFTNTSTNASGSIVSYCWNFGTGAGCQSTLPNPSFQYPSTSSGQSFPVKLIVTNSFGCSDTITQVITVGAGTSPDATLIDPINVPAFTVCGSAINELIVQNASSTTSTNTNYQINWGDGSPNFSGATLLSTLTHTYPSQGYYNLTFTVNGNNGCTTTSSYQVFFGTNPAGGITTQQTASICSGNQVGFIISGTTSNTPGTQYIISFNDGSVADTITAPIPDPYTISHIFNASSCGISSSAGSSTFPNSFGAYLTIQNACGITNGTVAPIIVSSTPNAQFINTADTITAGQVITFTNTGDPGQNNVNGVCTPGKIVWQISPNTGFTVNQGNLGTSSTSNPANWTPGSNSIVVGFNSVGTYTIKQFAANNTLCGKDSTVKTILVRSTNACTTPSVPSRTDTICSGNLYNYTPVNGVPTPNTVVPTGTTYTWTVAANPNVSGYTNQTAPVSSITQTLTNNTNTNQTVVYTVIPTSQTCVGNPFTLSVVVRPAPKLRDTSLTICSGSTFSYTPTNQQPTQIVPAGTTYTWPVPTINTGVSGGVGGSGSSITGSLANNTDSNQTVTYNVIANSLCGRDTFLLTVNINPAPRIGFSPTSAQTICSGQSSQPVTLFSPTPAVGFSWTATSPTGITGVTTSGSSTIPAQTLTNTTSSPITVTYIASATTNGSASCPGATATYSITVNPTPTVTQPANQTVTSGSSTTAVIFSGTVAGTSYAWTNNNTAIGLAASGTGNIPAFIAVNTTNSPITATITVTPNATNNCPGAPRTFTITVNPSTTNCIAEAILNSNLPVSNINGQSYFISCNTATSGGTVAFTNGSQAANNNYQIAWGDGSFTNLTQAQFPFGGSVNHTYAQGYYLITLYASTPTCTDTSTYRIFIGSNPSGGISTAGGTNVCSGTPLAFTIFGTSGNTPGTMYQLIYTDGQRDTLYHPIANPFAVSHVFNTTSCGITGTPNQNAHSVTLLATNSCGSISSVVTPIYISSKAVAGFTRSGTSDSICKGQSLTLTFTGNPGQSVSGGVCTSGRFYWQISPATPGTRFTVTSGNLGSSTSSGSNTITLRFDSTGNFTVKNFALNNSACGIDSSTRSILVRNCSPCTTPVIPAQTATICSGTAFVVSPVNGQPTPNTIVPAGTTYTWTVASNSLVNGETAQSTPVSVISQTLTSTTNTVQTVVYTVTPSVQTCVGTPFTVTVTINPRPVIANSAISICSGSSFTVNPVNSSSQIVPSGTTYSWTVASNTTITGASNGTGSVITQTLTNTTNTVQTVVYTVTPLAQNGCAGNPFTVTVTVQPRPQIPAQTLTLCSGSAFTVSPQNNPPSTIVPAGTTYTWNFTDNTQVSGESAQTTAQAAVSQTLSNGSAGTQQVVYVVTPRSTTTAGSACIGTAFSITATVLPVPVVNQPANLVLSNGSTSNGVPFTSTVNGTTYLWTNSNPSIGLASSGAGAIPPFTAINTTNAPITATIVVTPFINNCQGAPKTFTITVNAGSAPCPLPGTSASITGPIDVCSQIGGDTLSVPVTYTCRRVTGASSYTWTVPTGCILIAGQGDTVIQVRFRKTYVSGNISVVAVNSCGTSAIARALTVSKRIVSTPGTIAKAFVPTQVAAVTYVCGVTNETYQIRKVSNATSYAWSLSFGTQASITRLATAGVNDTAVRITFSSSFTADTLKVIAINPCSVSASKTIFLSRVLLPPTVSAISNPGGNFSPCIGDTLQYIATAPTPTSSQAPIQRYRWTIPANTAIVSANTDSSSISLRFLTGFSGGSLSARTVSPCAVLGIARTITFSYTPPTPTSIVSSTGSFNACIGNAVTYTVLVPQPSTGQRAASVYRWTRPANTVVLTANTDSSVITIGFNAGYTGGVLSVAGQTSCGVRGAAKTANLTHTGCPAGSRPIASHLVTTQGETDNWAIYPNPFTDQFMIQRPTSESFVSAISIYDLQGRCLIRYARIDNKNQRFGENLKPGVYMVELISDKQRRTQKIVIKQ